MDKDYEGISPQELNKGLEELEKRGELKRPRGELFQEVLRNTSKMYLTYGKVSQPVNAKLAKEESEERLRPQNSRSDSEILRANMLKAGRSFPKDTDAHHIVPSKENRSWAADYAAAARAILRRWGISINQEANGVALPSSSKIPVESLPNAYPHKTVHTKIYYLNIASQLGGSRSRTDCIDILREIGEELEDGTYPIRKKS